MLPQKQFQAPSLASDPSPQPSLGPVGFLNGERKHPWGCYGMAPRGASAARWGPLPQEAPGVSCSCTEQRPGGGIRGAGGRSCWPSLSPPLPVRP